jgi:hypothetical protein
MKTKHQPYIDDNFNLKTKFGQSDKKIENKSIQQQSPDNKNTNIITVTQSPNIPLIKKNILNIHEDTNKTSNKE